MTADPNFARKIERLCRLGPRPVGELFAEIVAKVAAGNPRLEAELHARLDRYAALDAATVRDTGADQFPKPPLRLVK